MKNSNLIKERTIFHLSTAPMCNCNVNVNVICLPTEHQGAQRTRLNVAVHSQIELEFGNVGFPSPLSGREAVHEVRELFKEFLIGQA